MPRVIKHYGTPRRSGRYPWGSGDAPQRSKSFSSEVNRLKKEGLSEKKIADGFGISIARMRARQSIEKSEAIQAKSTEAQRLKDKGYSNVEIGKRMGLNESSVRSLLNPTLKQRAEITRETAKALKETVKEKKYVDVGLGVERHMGISRTKLKTAIALLEEEEGYKTHYLTVEQLGTGKNTSLMVLTAPGVTSKELWANRAEIRPPTGYTEDKGRSYISVLGLETPTSVSSKRIGVRYAEDGGVDKDGVIELRRGVSDISLGQARYAQVRIAVDDTHYLKGMAMYSDDLPKGVDIMFNTNKKKGTPKMDTFKPLKEDSDNPFGATVRQKHYIDVDGKKKLSALNIVNEEGDWDKWSRTISSQVLSKQSPALAKKQLGLGYEAKKQEFDEIMALTNPIVKKKLLREFADSCDSSAVHLKAASLPRQSSHVILPLTKIKETEVYAPNYRDGENVVLIRYPHGGTFEIPELKVNNKNPEAKKLFGGAKDAIGIHPKVAERLSGADFDGDAVLVIPNKPKGTIKSTPRLKALIDFDPKEAYGPYDGMRTIDGGVYNAKTKQVDYGKKADGTNKRPTAKTKQLKMGDVSNLITDMTIRGAPPDEIARAVKHSMVVIDSEKHCLDYKRSYVENGIPSLKKRYQGSERAGASTLISKASSEYSVDHRKERPPDKQTGKKVYVPTNETYVNKNGKVIRRKIKSTRMAETDDAFTLSSGTPMESIYAAHANKLKALANASRKEEINTPNMRMQGSAKKVYASEVNALNAKLNIALKNSPLERQAQILANSIVSTKKAANPDMDAADIKKLKGQALAEARVRVGAKKIKVEISDREWEAIQAGAISSTTLTKILDNTDTDRIKQLATPRTTKALNPQKVAKAKRMLNSGRTQAEVAADLGISVSTLNKELN